MRFVAFPATEYDEILSGYQPGQMIERWANQRFEDHLCPRHQGTAQPFDPADSPRELHHINWPSESLSLSGIVMTIILIWTYYLIVYFMSRIIIIIIIIIIW
jgi:hypothetical protein